MAVQIILFAILSAILTLAHELGHLGAARALGVPVQEFSVGVGPVVYSGHGGGTAYWWRLLPVSGHVRFDNRGSLAACLLVFLAGPAVNLLLAVALVAVHLAVAGESQAGLLAGWLAPEALARRDAFSVAASLSKAYGLLNLLPLAGFDGGQCVALVVRRFRRPRPDPVGRQGRSEAPARSEKG